MNMPRYGPKMTGPASRLARPGSGDSSGSIRFEIMPFGSWSAAPGTSGYTTGSSLQAVGSHGIRLRLILQQIQKGLEPVVFSMRLPLVRERGFYDHVVFFV